MERRVRLLGIAGFGLWILVVVGLLGTGVVVALRSSERADMAGGAAFVVAGVFVIGLWRMPRALSWLRLPAGVSAPVLGVIIGRTVPKTDAVDLIQLGFMSSMLGLPLCWYLGQMGLSLARRRAVDLA